MTPLDAMTHADAVETNVNILNISEYLIGVK